ncbi:hypothetical protein GOC13_22760 [Sinorhizobium meliloti]|nr:hypothetical protein [Sinorhizobium meliloti]MDX0270577.1 hypothetical protein [Sinorhizobium meliloti]
MSTNGIPSPGQRMFNWKCRGRRAQMEVLRSGKIPVPPSFGLPDIDYSNGIDWAIFNEAPPSVRWWLNNLKCTRPLLMSSNPSDIERASKIIRSWVDANSVDPQSDFAWDGHATAFRSEQIACLKTHINEEWLDRSIIQHAEFLSDPQNYQGNWNHGLDQNIGLLSLGHVFNNREWIDVARERSIAAISNMVDLEGVSIEQAVSYHFYNYVRFQDAEAMFAECGAPLPQDIFEQVDRMTTFVAHATMPNGKWNLLGDTIDDHAERDRLANTDAGYSLSQGREGKPPVDRFAVYQSGYVFGRSGWGETRPFEDESYYSLRFGPGRVIHGHNDHTSLTYFARAEKILIDGGFHGYTGDAFRDHLRSPAAHNVVYAADTSRFLWRAETALRTHRIERDWQNYVLADEPYARTKRVRSVLLLQHPIEIILVLDRVRGPKRRYEQAWHFDEIFDLKDAGTHIQATSPKSQVTIHQLWTYDSIEIVKGRNAPPQGWGGYGSFDIRPIPTLLTSRAGAVSTFLTAMVVHPTHAENVEILQKPIKKKGVSRHLLLKVGGISVGISLMDDDTMRVESPDHVTVVHTGLPALSIVKRFFKRWSSLWARKTPT